MALEIFDRVKKFCILVILVSLIKYKLKSHKDEMVISYQIKLEVEIPLIDDKTRNASMHHTYHIILIKS